MVRPPRLGVACTTVGTLISLLFAAAPAASATRNTAEPLRIEAALHNVDIGHYDRPQLSADGKLLAYSTTSGPPLQSVTRRFGRERPLLPNGMLAALYGARLFIVDLANGRTLEVHAGGGSNWSPSFSPDGRQVAFLSDRGGHPQLWVADVTNGNARRVSDARIFVKMWSTRDRPVWTRDGRNIFVLVANEIATTDPTRRDDATLTTAIVKGSDAEASHAPDQATADAVDIFGAWTRRSAIELVDVASGARRTLLAPDTGPQPHAMIVSPSQDWIAFVGAGTGGGETYSASVLRVASGATYALGAVPQLVYDTQTSSEAYTTAVHWTPAHDRLVLLRDDALYLVDLTSGMPGAPVRLATELGPIALSASTDSGRFDQPVFTADGAAVITRLPARAGVAFGIMPIGGGAARRIDVSTSARFRGLVTAHDDVLWQPEPATIVFDGLDAVSGEYSKIGVDLNTGRSQLLAHGSATITLLASSSEEHIVGLFTDRATPPDLFLFDGKLRRSRRLTHVNPLLDHMPALEAVTFTTRVPSYDGSMRTLKTAVIFPSATVRSRPPPALVRVYPNNEISKYANWFGGGRLSGGELAQFWTTRGYAIVLPDLLPLTPAAQGNGNIIRELTDYLLPQLYRAADLGYIDIDRLVLTGHSAGGYTTAAVVTATSLFRAAVAYSPAPLDFFSTSEQWWPQNVAAIGADRNPWTAFKQYVTNSPFHQLDKIRTPILLVHGDADSIPSSASEQMYRGLAQLEKTAQLAIYQGESHYIGWWALANAIDANQRVLKFIQRYVPAGAE